MRSVLIIAFIITLIGLAFSTLSLIYNVSMLPTNPNSVQFKKYSKRIKLSYTIFTVFVGINFILLGIISANNYWEE